MNYRIKSKAIFEIFLVVSLTFIFAINISDIAYADEENRVCCQRTNDESYCQYTNRDNCDPNNLVFDNRCEEVSVCAPVCCNVNELGYFASGGQGCFKSVSLDFCRNELGGIPIQDAQCNVAECGKGCCIVGSQATLTTEAGCRNITSAYPDLEFDFRPDVTFELECSNIARAGTKGCCVSDSGTNVKNCGYITFAECNSLEGEFYEGSDCVSLPSDNNACDHCEDSGNNYKTGCAVEIDGGEDVYYFDKCGNPIISDRVTNGDCDYAQGTFCREVEENGVTSASCRSLNCDSETLWDNPFVDESGDCFVNNITQPPSDPCWKNDNKSSTLFNGRPRRLNTESWCEYDADAGPVRDLPGTRHYVHYCYEGEEEVYECEDYREEVCIQFDGLERSEAKCWSNEPASRPCTECNGDLSCCENRNFCVWVAPGGSETAEDVRRVNEERCNRLREQNNDTNYPCSQQIQDNEVNDEENGKCLPLIPPGTRYWEGDNSLCNPANSEVDTQWVNIGWGAHWDCEGGCTAFTQKFAYSQNSLCRSLGDCGADYNLAGEWSGLGFARTCGVSGKIRDDYEDGDVNDDGSDYLRSYGDDDADIFIESCLEELPDPANITGGEFNFEEFMNYKNTLNLQLPPEAGAPGWWDTPGMVVLRDLPFTIGVSVAGGVAVGVVIAAAVSAKLTLAAAASATIPVVGWIVAAVLIIVALITFGTSDSSTETVHVTCDAWQPPYGGENCNLCHEPGEREYLQQDGNTTTPEVDFTAGGKHQCTEYLCKSLGQGCMYTETDEGTKCVSNCDISGVGGRPDTSAPVIISLSNFSQYNPTNCESSNDPGADESLACNIDSVGYGYKVREFVKENTDFVVGIETKNERGEGDLATCRWDWNQTSDYDDLSKLFDQVAPATIHTATLEADIDIFPNESKRMYVICKDICDNPQHGAGRSFTIDFEVSKVRDIGAPQFISIDPSDGAVVKSELINNATQATLKLDECATCRWSRTNDIFDLMGNSTQFPCASPARGCEFTLTNLTQGVNTFFIKCKDRSNECTSPGSNANVDALPNNNGYRLIRSNPLNITEVRCVNQFGNVCGEIYDNNFTLELSTFGGGFDGRAICYYDGIAFLNTNSTTHTQVMRSGTSLSIRCEDDVGNEARTQVNYTMIIDNDPPRILRLTLESGSLNVLTDEIATCKHALNNTIIFDEMTTFEATGDKLHAAQFGDRDYLHVKCVDRFNHVSSVDVYRTKSGS